MLWIRDILIRIRRSVPLAYGFGFGSSAGSVACFFHKWVARCQQKKSFFSQCFCILLLEGTFTSVFKIKKSKRNHKIVEEHNTSRDPRTPLAKNKIPPEKDELGGKKTILKNFHRFEMKKQFFFLGVLQYLFIL